MQDGVYFVTAKGGTSKKSGNDFGLVELVLAAVFRPDCGQYRVQILVHYLFLPKYNVRCDVRKHFRWPGCALDPVLHGRENRLRDRPGGQAPPL